MYRIYYHFFKLGILDKKRVQQPDANVTTTAHFDGAQRVASEGTVLLKNEKAVLPLDSGKKGIHILVMGTQAAKPMIGGWGSG